MVSAKITKSVRRKVITRTLTILRAYTVRGSNWKIFRLFWIWYCSDFIHTVRIDDEQHEPFDEFVYIASSIRVVNLRSERVRPA